MNLLNKCTDKEVKLMKNAGVYLEDKDYSNEDLTATLICTLSNLGSASTKQEEFNKVKDDINNAENRLKEIVTEKLESDSEADDERLSKEYKEVKKHLNELRVKLESLSVATYDSFISENRCKEIKELISSGTNDECYLRLVDEVIIDSDNNITIIDNAGINLSKEEISDNIKALTSLKEVIHGYYSSLLTGKVYKYKIIRLEDKSWKNK